MAPSTCVLLFAEAFAWLCLRRKKYPDSSDIWDFRRIWPQQASEIMKAFWQGAYQLGLQQKITLANGETIDLWSACDALVLKVITWLIEARVRPSLLPTCYHLKGHGGLKGAVRAALDASPAYPFVCKTDVKSYYDSVQNVYWTHHTRLRFPGLSFRSGERHARCANHPPHETESTPAL